MSTFTTQTAASELLRFTRTHLRHHETLMRATGGHFNLFQIIGIGHYEVRTHSPILAELLNPKGRHGQGAVFLKLFMKKVGIHEDSFTAKDSKVTTEYHIGTKTENNGGRIDIVIEDVECRKILIENKIFAGDQENQLTRYSNFDPKARLFYLTLFGANPTNLTSDQVRNHRCECISYKDHIHDWLNACRKEAACLPGIREILSQYIALIEELTNQSTTKEMDTMLIAEITGSSENLKALFHLRDTVPSVLTSLISKLDEDLEKIASDLKIEQKIRAKNLDKIYSMFTFTTPKLAKHKLSIGFQFNASSYRDLLFGIFKDDPKDDCPVKSILKDKFVEIFPQNVWDTDNVVAITNYDDPYRNWSTEAFEAIRSGDLAKDIKSKLVKIVALTNEIIGI